jgi:hypothetical protein
VYYNWYWHWNYDNGDVGNQGLHETDLCLWGLNVGLPERITSMGGKFLWDDCKENWFDAIRARDMSIQNGPAETGRLSSALAHLGNISYRLGRQLDFDPVSERFIGDEDANNMLTHEYRPPYILPEKV